MVIYLAGLQGISADLYEASMLDGASRTQQFWRITVPLLKSTTFYVLVNMIIGSFGVFIQVMMLTSGNPGEPPAYCNTFCTINPSTSLSLVRARPSASLRRCWCF